MPKDESKQVIVYIKKKENKGNRINKLASPTNKNKIILLRSLLIDPLLLLTLIHLSNGTVVLKGVQRPQRAMSVPETGSHNSGVTEAWRHTAFPW